MAEETQNESLIDVFGPEIATLLTKLGDRIGTTIASVIGQPAQAAPPAAPPAAPLAGGASPPSPAQAAPPAAPPAAPLAGGASPPSPAPGPGPTVIDQTTALLASFRQLSTVIPVVNTTIGTLIGGVQGVIAPFKEQSEKYKAAIKQQQKADESHEKALKSLQKATDEYEESLKRVAKVQKESADETQKALQAVRRATEDYDASLIKANQAQREADLVKQKETAAGPPTPEGQLRIDKAQSTATEATRTAERKKESISEAEKNVESTKSKSAEKTEEAQKTVVQRRETVTEATATTQKTGEAAGEAAAGVKAAGGLVAGLGVFTAGIGAAAGAIEGFVSSVKGFVEALSPAQIYVFQQALKSLQATIGVAFQPIFQILTGTIREAAGIILPAMEALRPVVAQVTEVFAGSLISGVKNVVAIFEALMPVIQLVATLFQVLTSASKPLDLAFQVLATLIGANLQLLLLVLSPVVAALEVFGAVMDGISEVLNVLVIIFKTLVQTVTEFVKSLFPAFNLKDVFKQIADVTKKVIEGLLVFVATIAKFFGADAFLKNLINNLKPKVGVEGAATNASIKGFEQVVNDIQTASAIAAGGGGAEKKADLSDVVSTLEKIASGEEKGNAKLLVVLNQISDFLKGASEKKEQVKAVGRGAAAAGGGGVSVWLYDRLFGG